MSRRCVRTPVASALTLAATAPTMCSADSRPSGDAPPTIATVEAIAREVIAAIDALDALDTDGH